MAVQGSYIPGPGHPVYNHHHVTYVDIRPVERQYIVDFFEQRGPGSFNAECFTNGMYVVALYAVVFYSSYIVYVFDINALCVYDEFVLFCPHRNIGYFARAFYCGLKHCFDMLVKRCFFSTPC